MKLHLSTALLMASSLGRTFATTKDDHHHGRRTQEAERTEPHRRLRRQSHQHDGATTHDKGTRDSSSTSGGITHFSMGSGGHKAPVHSSGGNSNQDYEMHIVGGDQSDPGEFPYYVDMDGSCGGSLIAPGVVLSAAHCGEFNSVTVGAYQAGSTSNGAVERSVAETVFHPSYDSGTEMNDFMLVRLQSPVNMNVNVELVLNEDFSTPQDNEDLTVLGLGVLREDGNSPSFLHDVEVQAVGTNECQDAYGSEVDGDVMLCAGVDGGGKDSCQGDSGGPIVIRDGNVHKQVGVVSWGLGCARDGYPGVYARVSSAHDWIRSVVCDDWNQDASFCDGGGNGGGNGGGDGGDGGGDGGDGNNDPPSSCVDLTLELQTDDYGSDTEFFLVNQEEEFIWDEWGFRNNRRYEFDACVDPDGCATLDFFDWWGDGIIAPGYLKLTYDGRVEFDSGDIGSGEVFRFGNGC